MLSRICSKLGKRINQCYYNKNRETKTFANTSILSQELNFSDKNPNLSQQQLNVSDKNSILSQQTLNFPENSILSQQPLRITPVYQNIEPPSSILSNDTLINNLKNSSNISTFGQKFNKNYLKPLCLGQNRSRNLHGLHNFGSKNVFTNGNLSYNLSSSSNPSIFGQKFHKNHIMKPTLLCQNYCRNLHTLNNFGFTSIFNQNTLSKNFEKSSVLSYQPCRFLKLLEYQGDEILQETGIPTGKFVVVKNADEAEKMAESMQASDFMVKAQVLTGGRGKGKFKNSKISGVRTATSPAEVQKICKKMLGDYLVTKQTSDDGIVCNAVLVAERHFPRKEFYFAITMHRAFDGAVVIASTQGGMDIEEVAIVDPEAVLYEPIDAIKGLQLDQALEITKKLKIVETPEKLAEILVNLYKIFQKDAILVELNPLALDIHNNYLCLDCKMEFDESADFKQPEIFAKKDVSQLDSRELAAIQQNINYVALSGNIGCMVNGAGLAMATMDIIKLHGGEPANFLDVGGGATVKTVETCFEIITSNKQVDCIFVNIFGGIMRCDIIAQGIVAAAQKLKDKQMPIVCRLRGTNVAEAKAIIAASELRILTIDDLDECAKVVVKVSKIRHLAKEVSLDVNFELLGI